MAQKTMKKLRLYILQGQEKMLLRALMRCGCLEPERPGEEAAPESHGPWCPPEGRPDRTEEEALLGRALAILAGGAPIRKRRQKARLRAGEAQLLDEGALMNNLLLAERLTAIDENIRRCEEEAEALQAEIDLLRPWEALSLPMEWTGTRSVVPLYGTVPAGQSLEALSRAAEEVSAAVDIRRISGDGNGQRLMVLCMRSEEEPVRAALEGAGFCCFDFGRREGTVRPCIRAREKQLRSLGERKSGLQRELTAHGSSWEELRLGLCRLTLLQRRDAAGEMFLRRGKLLALEGWLPAEKEMVLADCLAGFDCAWETVDAAGAEVPRRPGKGLLARLSRRRRVFAPLGLALENVKIRREDAR